MVKNLLKYTENCGTLIYTIEKIWYYTKTMVLLTIMVDYG